MWLVRDGDLQRAPAHPCAPYTIISAPDLREAQKKAAHLRPAVRTGAVVLQIEALIAPSAAEARRQFASLSTPSGQVVRYIGTPAGLAGLIKDIYAVGIADGALVTPVDGEEHSTRTQLTAYLGVDTNRQNHSTHSPTPTRNDRRTDKP